MTHLILLSGGSGTRLWPLSNNARSKQFLKVLRDEDGRHVSMVQRVFGQISKVEANLGVTIATSVSQRDALARQIDPSRYALALEPERRDTAPAIMLACEHLALEQGVGPSDTVIVMPIDTYAGQGYYDRIPRIDEAVRSGASDLVLLGVEPTYPSEKYGYIIPAATEGEVLPVETFREKPDEKTARSYIERGGLWNCGVFAFRLGYLLGITKRYLDEPTFQGYLDGYSKLPKNSFDYEVVEKAGSISVVPYAGEWKDLGTWNTLTDEMAEAVSGRAVVDNACENVHVVNETGLPMVVAGLKDAVVVATPDGILTSSKEASASIKPLVAQVAETRPMYERRCWGEYRVLDSGTYADGNKSLTKECVIEPGKQLSYQRHQHRSEVWTIVSGTGEVVLDGEVIPVKPGSVINVQMGMMHACRGITKLHIIEVQQGNPLVEKDIERFGNFWGPDDAPTNHSQTVIREHGT